MAKEKRIIIPGENLLSSLTDDWGGENNTGEAITKYGTEIPDGYKWGVNFGEVEHFIKSLFGSNTALIAAVKAGKIGYIARVDLLEDGMEQPHLVAFATKEDYNAWSADNDDPDHQPLVNFELPSGGEGGSLERYIARLVVNPDIKVPSVVIGGSLNVELRFTSLVYSGGQYVNAGENGLLTFERSTDGGTTWQTVATSAIRSKESGYDSFDVAPYLVRDRETIIRAKASFASSGNTVSSIWVEVASATLTSLTVKNITDYTRPLQAGDQGYIVQEFAVGGAVDKYLHVEISGAGVYNTDVPAWSHTSGKIDASTEYPETNALAIQVSNQNALAHGVHTVKAWVTCDDGLGGELQSDIIVNRFMVVNTATPGADLYAPRLMLQGVVPKVSNYVHTRLASYAVWIPSSVDPTQPSQEALSVSIRLTDNSQSVEYAHIEGEAYNNVSYPIETTVEIEGEEAAYYAFLYIQRGGGINFMQESLGRVRVNITVDNTESYAPSPGADFVLNPKNRDNSESDPYTIVNAQTGRVVEGCSFEGFNGRTDLWVTADDGQKVLRVPAGSSVTIAYEPFKDFINDGSASLTFDLDFAVRNITQEDEPIVDVCQTVGGELLGLRMLPLEGVIKCAGHQDTDQQNFGWQEGVRTHLSLVLNPTVTVKAADELAWQQTWNGAVSRPLALAKVYINGVPYREMVYANNQAETDQGRLPSAGSWCRGEGHGGIRIGNPHAGIDIYGARCYRLALSPDRVRQNHIASLPDAQAKIAVKRRNEITRSGRIAYDLCKAKGYRCLTLVGQDQYKYNQNKKTGYPCYWRIDHDTAALSGTIGKASYLAYLAGELGDDESCLMVTPQGTTANTYWDNNEQTKIDGINYKVTIPFTKVHSDFGWEPSMSDGEDCECPMYLNGTRIEGSTYYNLDDAQKALVRIEVQDGWFDGNGWSEYDDEMGMYHGQFYTSRVGGAKCTKVVNKINYASSMQSHKMGATRLFHDLMVAVTGGNSLTRAGARYSVYEESFLLFNEHPSDNGKVEFRGMCTFGDGKFDKAVFGLKADSRTFAFEGLQNNLPLCDFRVPADENVVYDPDEESWMYAGVKSFEYGLGKTKTVDGKKYPTDAAEAAFRRFVNFVYCHNVSLRCFEGTKVQFDTLWNSLVNSGSDEDKATRDDMMTWQYWCSSGPEAFKLLRYDFVSQQWVDAGTWDQVTKIYSPGVRNLSTDAMTADAYTEWQNDADSAGDYLKLNEMFRAAIASHARRFLGTVADVENFKTHYNVVNFLLAGTDNCSKNLYYQYDPETGLIFLLGDDLDSILPTDNNGNNTKVYFLDRIHDVQDYLDGYKSQIDYEGRASALFNMLEAAYEETSNELRANMRQVLTAMVQLCGGNNASVLGCLEKYFFATQSYFPEVAWNEQARLRYEWPKSFGYISSGEQSRGIDPITQQVGSQLESERQYAKRRIALIASYAAWGDFAAGNDARSGLSDANASLSMIPGSGRSSGSYLFRVVPHQWIYPVGKMGNGVVDPHIRVAPGKEYVFNNYSASPIGGDQSAALAASNYYRAFGNLGDMVIGNPSLNVIATRLTTFLVEPTNGSTAFRSQSIALSAPNLRILSLRGASSIVGTQDFSSMTRLESLDLYGTGITSVSLPQSDRITRLGLPATLTSLEITGMPNLATLEIEGYSSMTSMSLSNLPLVNTLNIVKAAISANVPSVSVDGVDWVNVNASDIVSMAAAHVHLTGRVSIIGNINFAQKLAIVAEYGNVDDPTNGLYVYGYAAVNVSGATIIGERRTPARGDYQYTMKPNNPNANNVIGVEWSITDNDYAWIDQSTGVLHVDKKDPVYNGNDSAIISCTLHVSDGEDITADFLVGFYERPAQVGDRVFQDGTFCPADEVSDVANTGKTVIGLCFFSEDKILENGEIFHDRRMVALRNLTDAFAWGAADTASGIQGVSIDGISSVYDLQNLTNHTEYAFALNRANYWDGEWPEGDFKTFDATKACGEIELKELVAPMLGTPAGMVPYGKYNTLQIVDMRNQILNSTVWGTMDAVDGHANQATNAFKAIFTDDIGDGIATDKNGRKFPRQVGANSEYDVLRLLVDALNGMKDSSGTAKNYGHLLYPAASACFAYQPSAIGLAERFKAHNWYLPNGAEVARIHWHSQIRLDENVPLSGDGFLPLTADVYSYIHTSSEGSSGNYCVKLNPTNYYIYCTSSNIEKYRLNIVRPCCTF